MFSYICSVCGNIHVAEEAPQACPRCGSSSDKFKLKAAPERRVWNDCFLGGSLALSIEAAVWEDLEEEQPLFEGDLAVIDDLLDQLEMFFQFLKDAQTNALEMTVDFVSPNLKRNPEGPLLAFE